MKRRFLLLSALAPCVALAGVSDRVCTNLFLRGRTVLDNPVGHRVGEPIAFDFTLEGTDPVDAAEEFTATCQCRPEGAPAFSRQVKISKLKGFRFETKMTRPGFVRLDVDLRDSAGRRLVRDAKTAAARTYGPNVNFIGSAAAEPEKLRPFEPEPADFDAFWAAAKRDLAAVPMNPVLEEMPDDTDTVTRCFKVRLSCLGSRPATGFLTVPRKCFADPTYKVPVRLKFDGAGCRPQMRRERGVADEIWFHVNAHGFELARDMAYYVEFFRQMGITAKLPAYIGNYVFDVRANAEPRTSYMFGMVMRILRAIEFAKTLKEWNGRDLIAWGGSQGGLQTMWAAALGDGVTRAEPWVTWSCDLGGFKGGRWEAYGWRIPYAKGILYYDPVYMASRIPPSCTLEIKRVGLGDGVAPPTGIFITYNERRSPKSIRLVQGNGHDDRIPPAPNQEITLASAATPARETVDFDFGWRFARGPLREAWRADASDGEPAHPWEMRPWTAVDLPHDFQFELPWDEAAARNRGFKAMGEGWYRKHFTPDERWRGRLVSLEFGGIMCLGEVYLNGEKLADAEFGYLGLSVPVEKKLRWGEDNVVAVRATTGEVAGGRWYTGGGLYRSVKLVVRNPVSVSRHGVFVTTPVATADRAEVAVQVELDGWTMRTNDLEVVVTVKGPDTSARGCAGNVGIVRAAAPKASHLGRIAVKLPTLTVERPQLWDVDAPALYTAEVSLVLDGREVDRVSQRFGIRTAEFGRPYGFRLNGRKVFLQAMCNHHDLGGVGAAAYRRAIERQFRTMKAFGYNAIRCSHNPYSEDFYDLADELGILVVDELTDKWGGPKHTSGRPMTELFFPMITEWIRRDRNHPSVVLWSFGNELQHDEAYAGFPSDDWGVTTYRLFDVVAKRWDPTRPTTVAMYPARAGGIKWSDGKAFQESKIPPELASVTDVASINYLTGDYADYLRHEPKLNIFQSEATVLDCLVPYWLMDREHMVGLAYWGAIAYWGESQGWPAKGWNHSFFDHDLTPRPPAYLIRSAFLPETPIVRLAIDHGEYMAVWNDVRTGRRILSEDWNCRAGEKFNLVGYTNAEEVELLLNGRSLGVRRNDATEDAKRNIVTWRDVAWQPGRLEAVARNGGREVARHAIESTGEPVAIKVTEETSGWAADGHDLKYLRITAVDGKGRTVPTVAEKAVVEVTGEVRLIALDDGDQATAELFNVNEKKLRNGRLLAILRSTRTPGRVTVKVRVGSMEKIAEFVSVKR